MPEAVGPEHAAHRSMAILYGTETGNSEEIAGELSKMAERLHFETVLDEMNSFSLKDLLQFTLVVFVTSTTGQGDMPKDASELWKSLLRRKLPPGCLGSMKFTIFALGDSSYPRFNWAARKLQRRLLQLGASEFFKCGEGDERHDDGIDSIFIPWYQGLRETLLANYPLPASTQPIPDEVQLPPKMILRLAADKGVRVNRRPPPSVQEAQPDMDLAPEDLLPIPQAFTACVSNNLRVTPSDHWQDVRHLTFHISPEGNETAIPKLLPGSTLIVYPKNYPSDVQKLIDIMDWNEVADRPLERVPYAKRPSAQPSLPETLRHRFSGASNLHTWDGATLRDLLTHNFDITSVPKRSFINNLIGFTPADREKERLQELCALGNVQDFYDYTTRPRRTIIELLQDFPEVKIPFERTLSLFPAIRGREFSIANGGATLRHPNRGVTVEILAAIVEYRTIIRKPRQGVCSRYLKRLRPGATVRVGIKTAPSGPRCDPASIARPLLAIATGTGIAPIRSLVQERRYVSSSSSAPTGPAILFFGCRNEKADFYFRDEWESTPDLRVIPAFSRDPLTAREGDPEGAKNYVQLQIRRHAAEVAGLIGRGAAVCLCGNSGRMPLEVKEALLDALVLGGLVGSRAEAEEFWLRVDFWQETW